MSLWGNLDQANNAPKSADAGGLGVSANGQAMYGSTTEDEFVDGLAIGVFGVDANEQQAPVNTKGGHAGWVLRKEGTGGRAGRVHVETLVAMGSVSGDGEDDDTYVDTVITIVTQPQDQTVDAGNNATFTVVATAQPDTGLEYQWYNTAGDTLLVGETSDVLFLENVSAEDDGNSYYVIVTSGDVSEESEAATLTVEE